MKKYHIPIEPDKFYHIYNRGNNGDNLFYTTENYSYFLKKFDCYFDAFFNIYAFCLMPNHFHFLLQVKPETDIRKRLNQLINSETLDDEKQQLIKRFSADKDISEIISDEFQAFFISYSKSINKQRSRHGSLFEKPFKRIHVDTADYYTTLIWYIHTNPVKHGFSENHKNYPWSSYDRILNDKTSKLKKQEVINWFNNKENYIEYHNKDIKTDKINDWVLE